ncbi:MAG TPA: cytochrome P450 [Solirubrobacterales bacterium]|nr:cytochrome P450 [Solirubrobacterales bacterium]
MTNVIKWVLAMSMSSRSALPPGPRLPAAAQFAGFWTRPLAYLERCRRRYGRRFTIRLPATPPFVMLSDPDEVKEVFTAPPDVLRPGQGARVLEPLVGSNSVLLLDEGAHMAQRKLMLPAFHGERMERLTGLMEEVTAAEVTALPRGVPVPLHPRMQELTLKIILRAVFGIEPGARFDALCERLQAMLAFGDRPISLVPPKPESRIAKVAERVGPFAQFVRTQEEVDRIIFELIAERRAEGVEGDDVLAMLLEARHEDGAPMSDQEIRDELLTLLIAGHETTATSLAWAFERLVRERAVLDRLVEEIDNGEDAYVTATIQETLRARPVLPNVAPRLVAKPIEVGGWAYPPGCSLVANGYLIHHDADIYPDPYAFRPERFLGQSPGTYTWIPFGGGRRRCIGASFAMLEMTVVLRALLGACTLSAAADGVEVAQRRNITVRPIAGARAVLADRAATPVAA